MRLRPNRFGIEEGLLALGFSFVLAGLSVAAFGALSGHSRHPGTFGADVVSLVVYWACWLGAAVYASAKARRRGLAADAEPAGEGRRVAGARTLARRLRQDYGLELRPWPDLPLGAAVGVASQYLLVPAVEAPLAPFVPHLYQRLGGPAHQLAGGAGGAASLALLGVLVCVGSPLAEELFFRGLLLRAAAGRLHRLAPTARAAVSIALVSLLFGVAHFEALQLLGLVGFGAVLGALAWRTGRLGPGVAAHAAFNAVAFVQLALAH